MRQIFGAAYAEEEEGLIDQLLPRLADDPAHFEERCRSDGLDSLGGAVHPVTHVADDRNLERDERKHRREKRVLAHR